LGELRSLIPYLRRYRRGILLGLVCVFLANLFGLAVPYLLKEGIDVLYLEGAERGMLLRYALLVVGAAALGGTFRFGMRQLLNGISRRVEYDLRNDFFRNLLRLDARFYGEMPTGEIMSRATNDIQAVRMVAGPAYMYLVNTVFMTAFALALMIWIDPLLTLAALVPLLGLPPVTIRFGRIIHARFEQIQEQFGTLSTMVQENLAGVRIVKAYNQEEAQGRIFSALSQEYFARNVKLAFVSGAFYPMLGLLSGMGMLVVLWLGVLRVMDGQITVGEFIAFGLYLGMLSWPLIALGWVVNLFQRGAASMRRINRVLHAEPDIQDPAEPRLPARIRGEIEFRHVGFRYPGTEREVLRDLSFTVPAGSTVAVVGPTGSGKSSLIQLLARRHDPTAGEILLDGVPLREWPLATLREQLGVVPQDTFLFSESIAENLLPTDALDDPEVRKERIRAAARVAQLEEEALTFPRGMETMLGERGINLSGGQKQRATLARAIARDPRVLILDDALSAVDTHTERRILEGLREVRAERTSLVVSHRVSAVMDADLILVLEDGRVVERGTHDALLAAGGTYAILNRRQMLTRDIDGASEGVA
jgi:ATP-binding cassette, subfamily B, multidrug efflux pump